jgi:hypothetical protein
VGEKCGRQVGEKLNPVSPMKSLRVPGDAVAFRFFKIGSEA